jgi:hypothetical protein
MARYPMAPGNSIRRFPGSTWLDRPIDRDLTPLATPGFCRYVAGYYLDPFWRSLFLSRGTEKGV